MRFGFVNALAAPGLSLLGGIAKFAEHAGETPPRELSG
jgi:hypothetical protein